MTRDSFAYTHAETAPSKWSVLICERGVQGYRPVDEYGPYDDEARAEGVASRLNDRLGITSRRARDIVRSTMVKVAVTR